MSLDPMLLFSSLPFSITLYSWQHFCDESSQTRSSEPLTLRNPVSEPLTLRSPVHLSLGTHLKIRVENFQPHKLRGNWYSVFQLVARVPSLYGTYIQNSSWPSIDLPWYGKIQGQWVLKKTIELPCILPCLTVHTATVWMALNRVNQFLGNML